MGIVKIKTNGYDTSALRAVNNKLIMHKSHLFLFTDVKVTTEEETYGRKKNKTRNVEMVQCQLHGWNKDGEFMGVFEESYIKTLVSQFDILALRKNYIEFQKKFEAMTALEKKYNELPLMDQVEALLREGKKLHALKLYKEETGKGLKEAKVDIDKLWVDLGLTGNQAII